MFEKGLVFKNSILTRVGIGMGIGGVVKAEHPTQPQKPPQAFPRLAGFSSFRSGEVQPKRPGCPIVESGWGCWTWTGGITRIRRRLLGVGP